MAYAIYDLATGAWGGEPADTDVHDPEAQGAIEIVAGYPDLFVWSADLPGFVRAEPSAPALRYSFNQWVDLFPLAEQIAIVTATMTDPLAKLIYDRAQSASGSIDPKDVRTVQGLQYLVSKGWVSEATYARIAAI